MRGQRLQFGSFEFDVGRKLLFSGAAPVVLGKRGAALLGLLLSRRGEVVTKEDLIEAAWPGLVVEEANLSVQISALRRALGRTSGGGEWIVTMQRIGYRFVPDAGAQPQTHPMPTLAILPFTDFDTGVQSEADGLVEDLTTALSKFKSIRVVARNSSSREGGRRENLPQLARLLQAGYLLEGSLRRIGGRARANVQLIDGATGAHLWAEAFDRNADLHGTGTELVERIAAMVEPQIQAAETSRSRAERPESASAYDLYLRARWLIRLSDERGNAAAYGLLQRALKLQPENIHILAAAAEVLHHRISVGWPLFGPDHHQLSLDIATRGAELGIEDGAALGLFSNAMFTAREWDIGRMTSERAMQANPNSSMALVCAGNTDLWLGRTEPAALHFERAALFGPADPNRRFAMAGLAHVARRRGDYEAATEFAKRSLAIAHHSAAYWTLIAASAFLGRLDEARRQLARFRAVSPHTTLASIRKGQPVVDERLLVPVLDALAEAGLPEA